MTIRKKKHRAPMLLMAVLILATAACSILLGSSAENSRVEEAPFNGVTYTKAVLTSPRKMVVHILTVNVAQSTIKPIITPPDAPDSDRPYRARTTSEFAMEFSAQLAINGGGFQPWYDYKVIYSPHAGDFVAPQGRTISESYAYDPGPEKKFPLLLFGGKRPVDISYIDSGAKYALSGTRMLVEDGQLVAGLNDLVRAPRTAAGVDQAGHILIIVIVDGRQSGYSKGATLKELAQLLLDNGAYTALELDGGGSSTLVINKDGTPTVLNSPIHQGIPGRERPVATHIGFLIE